MNIITYAPILLSGLYNTLILWFGALSISMTVGTALGLMSSNKLSFTLIAPFISIYIWILRGIPVYVQVLIIYFVLPDILNINLSAYWAAIIALGACSSAYTAEIIRTGINAIDIGQWEASAALGFSKLQTLRYIIMPQMIKIILPALANEWEALIKSTSILSTIGVLELTRVGQNIIAHTMQPVSVYLLIAGFYLGLSTILLMGTRYVEHKMRWYK